MLEQASQGLGTPILEARALRLTASLQLWVHPSDDAAILLGAARSFEGLDARMARETYTEALQAALVSGQLTAGTTLVEVARAALEAPRPIGDETTVLDLMREAWGTRFAVGYRESADLLRGAVQALATADVRTSGRTLLALMGYRAALEIWDADGYRRMVERLERTQRSRGERDSLRVTLLALCRREMWAGRFASARAYHNERVEISVAIDGPGPIARTFAMLDVRRSAWEGNEEEVRSVAARAHRATGGVLNAAGNALGILENSLRHYRAALESAWPVFEADVPADGNEAIPEVVEAAVRIGHRDAAVAALSRMEMRASVAATPWALGLLARCRALMAEGETANEHYGEALVQLGRAGVMPDLGRAHLLYGEWLRRERRRTEARDQLHAAHDMFSIMGASSFAERARIELAATGDRVAQPMASAVDDLTPQELHVARLAATGRTNTEIGAQLFISANTVDYHLRKVYRKLDVTKRGQLASALTAEGGGRVTSASGREGRLTSRRE